MLQNSCPHDLNPASRNHVGLFSHSVLFRVNNFTHSVWAPWNQGMAKEFNRASTEDLVSTHSHFRALPVRQGNRVRREVRVGQEPWSPWALLLWALQMPGASLNLALFTVISTLLSAVPRPLQSRDLSITLSHDYICILPGCKRAIAQIHGVTVGSCNQTSLRDFQPNCLGAIFTPTPGKPYTTNSWICWRSMGY